MRVLLVMLIGLGSFLSPYASPSAAQTGDILPADLLFTGLTAQTPVLSTLMRVDAQTLQVSPFYVDEGSLLRALSWSPAGDLLAILRKPSVDADYLEICLLTRAGVLQSCFEDRIASHAFRERGTDYLLTWSEDGQYVYFVSDYDLFHWNEGSSDYWGARLVKAEVATGQTQEILYQTDVIVHNPPPLLFWTDDLHYLLVVRGRFDSSAYDLWQDTEITLPLDLPNVGYLRYCPRFSPQGQHLTARAIVDDTLTGLALVSPTGQIIQTIGSDRLQQEGIEWMECPVWRSDEAAFYFLGGLERAADLFRYDLADDTFVHLKQLYPSDPQEAVFRGGSPHLPMRLAPDDMTLAITFWESSLTDIRILAPTNEWIIYGGVEASIPVGSSPIWVPPLPAPPTACTLSVAAGDATGLISAINAANANPDPDTICLAADSTYTLTAPHNTTFGANGLPPITTDITLVGNGATIARDPAAPPFRLLFVDTTGALTLENVTLVGGLAGVADPGDNGGAVYNLGTLTLIDSAITASSANGDGGGIYNAGTLTLSEASRIESNFAADDGGGIYSTAGAVIVIDSAIANNSVGDQGGGIRSVTCSVTLTNASLTGNSASSASGGGLYATSTDLAVHGGTISGNVANTGGGLYLTNSPSSAQIDGGVQIVNNSATSGGGLYLSEDGQAALTNVRVAGNQASGSSAGIRMGGTLTITDSEISNNGSATQPGSGGGIRTSGALTIINSALTGNQVNSSSGLGAGIYVADGGTVSVIGGEVSDNHAYRGGGFYVTGSLGLSTTVSENSATGYGGGLYVSSGAASVDYGTFTGNTASITGGGIYNNSILQAANTLFSGNSANDRAGAVYAGSVVDSWVHSSCIEGNTSPNTGGVYSGPTGFDATNNWWGATDGPSGAGSGSGDAVNNKVTFTPFLTTACPAEAGAGTAQEIMSLRALAPLSATRQVPEPVRLPIETAFADESGWWATGTWLLDTLVGHDSAPSWAVNTVPRDQESTLELLAPVALGRARSPRLTFWQRGQIATSDRVIVEILPQGETTWIAVDHQTSLPADWTQHTVDLSAYRGQTVRLRFRVVAGGELSAGDRTLGLWIDDLSVTSR